MSYLQIIDNQYFTTAKTIISYFLIVPKYLIIS
jgi:hypothetical protein